MTGVETVNRKGSVLSDLGKTSPLTDLSSPSPPYFKSDSYNEEQLDITADTNPTTRDSDDNSRPNGSISHEKPSLVSTTRDGEKSIASYESSDLSDLDSEAETEKTFSPNGTPKQSQLSKLSKAKQGVSVDEVMRKRLDDIGNGDDTLNGIVTDDNTLIKEDITEELENGDESDIELDQDISKVMDDLRKNEDASNTRIKRPSFSRTSGDVTNGKRKHQEDVDDAVKRRKGFVKLASAEEDQESHVGDGTTAEHEAENEGEDEGEEEEEEEPADDEAEEELTEEQILLKQKEVEAELVKQKERKEAMQQLTELEIEFAKLRDRLYDDKMARFKAELEMCMSGTHPEMKSVYTKIDAHREEKVHLSSLNHKYRIECIDRQIRAQRTAVHQQFFKRVSDSRTQHIQEIMHAWDQINKERREMDVSDIPQYEYRVPEYVDQVVHERAQVNQEISNLVGLQFYYGFPTAPKLSALDGDDLDNDLRAMNIPLSRG